MPAGRRLPASAHVLVGALVLALGAVWYSASEPADGEPAAATPDEVVEGINLITAVAGKLVTYVSGGSARSAPSEEEAFRRMVAEMKRRSRSPTAVR